MGAATEARALGRGGVTTVAAVTGAAGLGKIDQPSVEQVPFMEKDLNEANRMTQH